MNPFNVYIKTTLLYKNNKDMMHKYKFRYFENLSLLIRNFNRSEIRGINIASL